MGSSKHLCLYVVSKTRWYQTASILTCQPRTVHRKPKAIIIFYELASLLIQHQFCHILMIEAVTKVYWVLGKRV